MKIIIRSFLVDDKDEKIRFCKETFILIDINMYIIYKIFVFIINIVEIKFNNEELRWRLYININTFFTIKRADLVGKKEFTTIVLDVNDKIFIIYVTCFANSNYNIYPFCKALMYFFKD